MVQSAGEFAQQLRTLREAQGMSMRALAGMIGVSSVTVWKWEKGDSKPRARLIQPLAKALDVPPRQLQSSINGSGQAGVTAGSDTVNVDGVVAEEVPATREEDGAVTEQLPDVIARAKQMIAEASGTGSNNITILIEY